MKPKVIIATLYLTAAIFLVAIIAVTILEKSAKPQNAQNLQNLPSTINSSTNSSTPDPALTSPGPSNNPTNTNTQNQNIQTGKAIINATVTCMEKIDKIPCKGWLVVTTKTGQEIARKQSNENGELTIQVPSDDYVLKGVSSPNYPVIIIQPENISLKENGSIKVGVNYWTGLR